MIARLLATNTISGLADELEGHGCTVNWDKEAGTISVLDAKGNRVLAAIQKGYNQPWIAGFTESDLIKWDEQKL